MKYKINHLRNFDLEIVCHATINSQIHHMDSDMSSSDLTKPYSYWTIVNVGYAVPFLVLRVFN